jgi:hypothetical protein
MKEILTSGEIVARIAAATRDLNEALLQANEIDLKTDISINSIPRVSRSFPLQHLKVDVLERLS